MSNGVPWNKQITRTKRDYKYITQKYVTCGAETYKFNNNLKSKLISKEIDFLRRFVRCSGIENTGNIVIREKLILKIRF